MVMKVGVDLLGAASAPTAPAASYGSLVPLLLLLLLMVVVLMLLLLQGHLQLVVQPRDGPPCPCVAYSSGGGGAVGAYDALRMIPFLGGLPHVVAQPFAGVSGWRRRLRLRLRLLRWWLLGVVMGTLGGRTGLGLQQVLDEELVVIVDLVLRPLRRHSEQGRVRLCFGGCGVIGLRLRAGGSGVGIPLWGGQKGGGENRGDVFI